jgi:PAS domain S-box-containing protein
VAAGHLARLGLTEGFCEDVFHAFRNVKQHDWEQRRRLADIRMTKDSPALAVDGLQIFDGYPAPSLIVDEDVRLLMLNRAARVMFVHGPDSTPLLMKRGGEVLRCIHSSGPGGCGRLEQCKDCVIRSSVQRAQTTGAVHRARSFMRLRGERGDVDVCLLVSASPIQLGGRTRVLVTLENVSDVHLKDEFIGTEQALRNAHERLESLARFPEENPDPVLRVTADLTLLYANDAARSALGAMHLDVGRTVPPQLADPARRALADDDLVRTELSFGDRAFSMSFCPAGPDVNVYGQEITERKRAEEALRETDLRYRLLFQNMLDGFAYCRMLYDESGRPQDFVYLDVNGAFGKLTGLHDVVGKKVSEVIPGIRESQPELLEIYGRVTKTGRPESFEIYFRPLEIWLSISVYSPQPDHFVAVFDNVTDRKRAMEHLTSEKERLAVTLSSIGDAVIATDQAARVTVFNGVAEELTGWKAEEAVGRPLDEVFEIIHEETRQPAANPVSRVLREGVTVGLANHTALVARDGTERSIADSAAPIRDAGGRITGVVLVFRDQTQERRAQRYVRIRLALLEFAASHSLEELLRETLDQIGRLTGSPIGFYHFVESDQKTVLLQTWSTRTAQEFCKAEGRGRHYPIDQAGVWVDCVRERRPVIHNDYSALPHRKGLPEGHAAIVRELVVPVLREGRIVAIVGLGNKPTDYTDDDVESVSYLADVTWEITSRKRAEDALRESDQRKSEFLAVLSHELRNPLTPIRNSIHLLDLRAPGSEQAARAKDVIRRQTEHLARLVDDLLDVTRVSRGKIELQRELFDLREIVGRACDDHRTLFDGQGIALRVETHAPVWIQADATRIAQIVGNLLQNAAKFTQAGGIVTARVGVADGWAEIRVRDNGTGVAPDILPRVFEPFVQAEGGLARTKGGLGLGLALVKGLVELHGGSVRASSEGAGRGSEFVVTLPLAPAPTRTAPGAVASAPTRTMEILVIDDNLDGAQSIAELLETVGHRVEVATNGLSGIAKARELKPQVILCDIGLPDVNGYEVARAVRADEALRSTRLVALTGYARSEDQRRATEAGFDAHLAKPASLSDLLSLLSNKKD